jgi:hypothetical protein
MVIAVSILGAEIKAFVSSAKRVKCICSETAVISLMYNKNKRGPKMEP